MRVARSSLTAPTLPPESRMQAWYWRLPYLSMALLAACLLVFVWLGLRAEREELRSKLISDVLWIEQNLHRHFESVESLLSPMATALMSDDQLSDDSRARVRQLLQSDTGLTSATWLDIAGAMRLAVPPRGENNSVPAIEETVRRARTLSKTAYSTPYRSDDGSWALATVVPGYDDNRLTGFVVAEYSLAKVLAQQVPWWFAERYRISIHDGRGNELASRSKVDAVDPSLTYDVTMEPPGGEVTLHVEAYEVPSETTPNLLVGGIAAFGVIMLWSLWMLRRQLIRLNNTQTELRAEHAFRLAMEDSMLVGIRARDLNGRTTYVNAAFCKMVGYTTEELIGMQAPMAYWVPEEMEYTQAVHDRILAGKEATDGVEVRYRRKDGTILDILLVEAPLIDANGKHAGWMGSVLDVTERRRAEALARSQQERLEATGRLVTMGEMASSLAHEINQPLSAISSYSAGCLNALESGRGSLSEIGTVLGKINHQAQRAGRIIRRVYAFVRRSEPKRERVDANQIMVEASGLVETDARKRSVRLQLELATTLPPIEADPVMIEQLLVNLIRNGMDAMQELPVNDRVLTLRSEQIEDRVRMTVIDRGSGVPAEIADKLFDSFFTTKSDGMGMGLKICRSIAEQHHGRLWFEAVEPHGTAFHLQIPVAPEAEPQEDEALAVAEDDRNGRHND
ncbi:MAG: PAS domain S-box protein [Moraxellaceae bacterium]|nr:PAS domain S-box protein [Moraxellaceae bacterium]